MLLWEMFVDTPMMPLVRRREAGEGGSIPNYLKADEVIAKPANYCRTQLDIPWSN